MSTREPKTIEAFYKNGDMEVVRQLCKQWRKDKMTNPITSKPLTAGPKSKIYQNYERLCREVGVHTTSNPTTSQSSSNRISASQSESSETKLARHMSLMDLDENLDTVGRWAVKKCANENPITLMPFDNDDRDVVSIRVQRRDGKFIKKGMCITKSSLWQLANNDLNIDYTTYRLPQMFMSNWIQKDIREIQPNGMGGCAGHKVFVKIPPNNIYISLGSFMRLMKSTNEKEWYAVPMFRGEKQRVGNMFSMLTVIGSTHGQAPGSVIYKLHTRKEVETQPHLLGVENKNKEYHVPYVYNIPPAEQNMPLDYRNVPVILRRIIASIPAP